MDLHDRRYLLAGAGLLGVAAMARTAQAGSLNPPGAPAPTGKTTQQLYDAITQLPPAEQRGESRNQETERRHLASPYRVRPSMRVMNAAICSQFFASRANCFRPCLVME